MSNAITNACRPVRISPTPKNVLLALADRADDAGATWPSISTLSDATCYSPRAVINALHSLEQAGYVVIERTVGCHNRYRINLVRLVEELQRVVDLAGGNVRREVKDALDWATHAQGDTDLTSAPGAPMQQTHQRSSSAPTHAADAPPPVQQVHIPVQQMHPNHQEPSGNPQPIVKRARDVDSQSAYFRTFWSAYPRKESKPKALKAFEKLDVDDKLLASMVAAIGQQSRSEQWRKDAGRFVPHAATWLNDRRWEDGGNSDCIDELRPSWALNAGFANRYDAENAGCRERNAATFSGGRRIAQLIPVLESEGAT